MGNSKSKAVKAELNENLDQAEKKHASAAKTVVVREEELERCKKEAATSTAEAETLRKKADDLEAKYDASERVRAVEVESLKKELARELEGQVRIHESLTEERNRERRRVEQLEAKIKEAEKIHGDAISASGLAHDEKIKALLQASENARQEAEAKQTQLQRALDAGAKDLETVVARTTELEGKALALEEEALETTRKISAAETARSEIERKHSALTSELTSTRSALDSSELSRRDWETKYNTTLNPLNSELDSLHTDLSTSQQKQKDLNKQVTTMQKKLDLAESKRGDLEKKYNESVSKKSALHEAFEATKIELKDSYQRFNDLHREHTDLREEMWKLRQQVKEMEQSKAKTNSVTNGEEVNGAVLAAQAATGTQKAPSVGVEEIKNEQTTV